MQELIWFYLKISTYEQGAAVFQPCLHIFIILGKIKVLLYKHNTLYFKHNFSLYLNPGFAKIVEEIQKRKSIFSYNNVTSSYEGGETKNINQD